MGQVAPAFGAGDDGALGGVPAEVAVDGLRTHDDGCWLAVDCE